MLGRLVSKKPANINKGKGPEERKTEETPQNNVFHKVKTKGKPFRGTKEEKPLKFQENSLLWTFFQQQKQRKIKHQITKSTFLHAFLCAQLSFCVCVRVPNYLPILKNSLFQKRVQKLGVSMFCVKLKFWKLSFLGLLKHNKIGVSANVYALCCWKRRNRQTEMITGISGFGFVLSKNGRFMTHICFSKNALLKPLFL